MADLQKGRDAYDKGDYATALEEWKPLALGGDGGAQFNLALMYDTGTGVSEDAEVAVKWYTLSALQGIVKAQTNLGVMYATGRGAKPYIVIAYMWLHIASLNGDAGAVDAKKIIVKSMTQAQVEEAEKLAAVYIKKIEIGDNEPSKFN